MFRGLFLLGSVFCDTLADIEIIASLIEPEGVPATPPEMVCASRRRFATAATLVLTLCSAQAEPAEPDFVAKRAEMVPVIERYAREPGSAVAGGRLTPGVLQVMGIVPRHEFVPEELRANAYADRPLPIGFGQTISQPFI